MTVVASVSIVRFLQDVVELVVAVRGVFDASGDVVVAVWSLLVLL